MRISLDKSFNRQVIEYLDEKALGRQPFSGIEDWIYNEIEARFGPSGGKQDAASTDENQAGADATWPYVVCLRGEGALRG